MMKRKEDFKVELWPINKPVPYDRNPVKHGPLEIEKLKQSLAEFGWQQPIVVDKDAVIVAGHGRLVAALALGMTHVPVHVATELTEAQAKAYRLMDNRVREDAEWDEGLLQGEILDLAGLEIDLKLSGFNQDEIAGLRPPEGWEGEKKDEKKKGGKMGKLEYRVIIDCTSEDHQAELLARFESEGLKCKPLIS